MSSEPRLFKIVHDVTVNRKVPSIICTHWFPQETDEEIFKFLRKDGQTCVQIDRAELPDPVRRIFDGSRRKLPDRALHPPEDTRYFKVESATEAWYAAIPNDPKSGFSTHITPEWLKKRQAKWVELRGMTSEQIDAEVERIAHRCLDEAPYNGDWFLGEVHGFDMAIEIFNWTALEYDDALSRTAKVLFTMLAHGKVRLAERDLWTIHKEKRWATTQQSSC